MADSISRAELKQAFLAHRDSVYRFLWRLTGSRHDAEDLLQETFVRYWRKGGQFRSEGSLAGYLKRIAFRTFQNARSRAAAKRPPRPLETAPETEVPDAPPGEALAEEDARDFLLERVREALRSLPEGPREAFLLFRFENLTVAEVAAATDTPKKTVESRLKRATELLAARLRRHRDQLTTR